MLQGRGLQLLQRAIIAQLLHVVCNAYELLRIRRVSTAKTKVEEGRYACCSC